ncbi:hypothetical protein BRAS3843_1820003 [Bradyrhizobium sp. STM 3843]|nr:hypothetical protein BRAS3843_1820003 [Bradyrhizobium sp. STM 3843]
MQVFALREGTISLQNRGRHCSWKLTKYHPGEHKSGQIRRKTLIDPPKALPKICPVDRIFERRNPTSEAQKLPFYPL